MIDLNVFAEEIGILADFYNRKFEGATLKRLRARLSEQMNTEQFRAACAVIFDNNKFFPNVSDFVQAIHGHQDALASEEWNKCIAQAKRVTPYDPKSYEIELSATGRLALREVGGLTRLAQMTDEREPWIKKEFLGLWKSYAINTPSHIALPEARTSVAALPEVKDLANQLSVTKQNGNGN